MNKYLLLITTEDRFIECSTFIESVNLYIKNDWKLIAVCQGHTTDQLEYFKELCHIPIEVLYYPERLGMFNARQEGIKHILAESEEEIAIVTVDDDMILLPQTNYENLIKFVKDPSIGLVSANWISHENFLNKRKLQEKLVKQAIVYTGGGMAFGRAVAELIAKLPQGQYFSDNSEIAVKVYVAGYENYRYLGSLTMHKACRKGGRKKWVNEGEQKQLPDPKLLTIRLGKAGENAPNDNKLLIADSSDLTELAHKLHNQNKAVLQRK